MSVQDKDAIINKLAELAGLASPGNGIQKKASTLSATDKEFMVTQMLKDPSGKGLRRIAYAMTEPLRVKLDYVGIGRKLLETDLLPQGAVPEYDKLEPCPSLN